jgi:hypothetical protein
MKGKSMKAIILLLAGSMALSSCVGSFSLFNKLADWNKNATKDKFLNEIIFLVISPAYAFCGAADVFVLNTIEFWNGSNPLVSNEGKTQYVMGEDGKMYAVRTLKNGYEVTSPEGSIANFVYNKKANSWSMLVDGKAKEIFRFNNDGTIRTNLPSGQKMNVSLNDEGLYQTRMAINGGTFFALR